LGFAVPGGDPGHHGEPITLTKKATLKFGAQPLYGVRLGLVTAADVTADGSAILVRTYQDVLHFNRPKGAPLYQALATRPCAAPTATEKQGESIAAAATGGGYYTLSEGKNQALHF